jgi:hypothetical protein
MSLYNKYLKYQNKYLELTGGSKATTMNIFKGSVNRSDSYEILKPILKSDTEKGFLLADRNVATIPDIGRFEDGNIFDQIFEKIYNSIEPMYQKSYSDWIFKSYTTNTFGVPSSLENYGRFKDAIDKYTKLKNRFKDEITNFPDINGLIELETYVNNDENTRILEAIIELDEGKKAEKIKQRLLKEKGEPGAIVALKTDTLIIYKLLSEDGSKYYGLNSRWCTAAIKNCMYNRYAKEGPLYIIQSNTDIKDKYQIHPASSSIMDSSDEHISVKKVIEHFDDPILTKWLPNAMLGIFDFKIIVENETVDIVYFYNKNSFKYYIESSHKYNGTQYFIVLKKLGKEYLYSDNKIYDESNKIIDSDTLLSLSNNDPDLKKFLNHTIILNSIINIDASYSYVRNVIFSNDFNEPISDFLGNLINLKSLTFGNNFNSSLLYEDPDDDRYNLTSFDKLIYLDTLIFGNNFNQSLDHILNNLRNLEVLVLGNDFNRPLDNVVDKLPKLKILKLGDMYPPQYVTNIKAKRKDIMIS